MKRELFHQFLRYPKCINFRILDPSPTMPTQPFPMVSKVILTNVLSSPAVDNSGNIAATSNGKGTRVVATHRHNIPTMTLGGTTTKILGQLPGKTTTVKLL